MTSGKQTLDELVRNHGASKASAELLTNVADERGSA
jgi:hypothetical protein